MQKLYSSVTGIAQGTELLFSDHENDGPMWAGEGPREVVLKVDYGGRFKERPAVFVSLAMIDGAHWTNQRIELKAQAISRSSFEIHFKTWADTKIARAAASWMAIGDAAGEGDWDV